MRHIILIDVSSELELVKILCKFCMNWQTCISWADCIFVWFTDVVDMIESIDNADMEADNRMKDTEETVDDTVEDVAMKDEEETASHTTTRQGRYLMFVW